MTDSAAILWLIGCGHSFCSYSYQETGSTSLTLEATWSHDLKDVADQALCRPAAQASSGPHSFYFCCLQGSSETTRENPSLLSEGWEVRQTCVKLAPALRCLSGHPGVSSQRLVCVSPRETHRACHDDSVVQTKQTLGIVCTDPISRWL